jgi:AraC-like DNA-binding protein
MVEPVERDARGILHPDAGLQRFSLTRHAPTATVARFVDRYWVATWDLPDGDQHRQQVLVHPVVNVVLGDGDASTATVSGVQRRVFTRVLEGRGRVLGVMFRPGGFRPFLDGPVSALTDRVLPVQEVLGTPPGPSVPEVEGWLAGLVPAARQPCEDTVAMVERVAADRGIRRVDDLARLAGETVRSLQRRFADHVGISPKWVIRRYRLYEAAERAARDDELSWADLAAELGYADQAHLVRDFTATVGMPPQRYASLSRAAPG